MLFRSIVPSAAVLRDTAPAVALHIEALHIARAISAVRFAGLPPEAGTVGIPAHMADRVDTVDRAG